MVDIVCYVGVLFVTVCYCLVVDCDCVVGLSLHGIGCYSRIGIS